MVNLSEGGFSFLKKDDDDVKKVDTFNVENGICHVFPRMDGSFFVHFNLSDANDAIFAHALIRDIYFFPSHRLLHRLHLTMAYFIHIETGCFGNLKNDLYFFYQNFITFTRGGITNSIRFLSLNSIK